MGQREISSSIATLLMHGTPVGGPDWSATGTEADIVSLMMSLLPSLVFVFTLLAVVLNVLVARRMIGVPHAFTRLHESKTFRMPDGFVWFVIAYVRMRKPKGSGLGLIHPFL